MEITLRPAHQLSDDVWEAELEPGELSVFGRPLDELGPISVIQVAGGVTPDPGGAALRFDHRHARVLNRGVTTRILVIANMPGDREEAPGQVSAPGDQRFLSDLRSAGPHLYQLGSQLLTAVRSKSPGLLTRDAIEVRGDPGQFLGRQDPAASPLAGDHRPRRSEAVLIGERPQDRPR
jgi:hypothetical protein